MKKDFNITKPQYSEHVLPVLWPFVKSRFHCTWKQMTLSKLVSFQPHVHYYWHLAALIFLFRKCTTGWEPISKFPLFYSCTPSHKQHGRCETKRRDRETCLESYYKGRYHWLLKWIIWTVIISKYFVYWIVIKIILSLYYGLLLLLVWILLSL